MRNVQRSVWEGASIGGGAAFASITTGRATRFTDTRTAGAMMLEELCGPVNCAAGSGRLGETLQQVDIAEPARILLDDVSDIFSIIAAIFGQCGSHG
jgi:hypothetical protein